MAILPVGLGLGSAATGGMKTHDPEQLARENAALRRRTEALSAAMLRIGGTLDVTTVLKEIVHSARTLAGARYGIIITTDDAWHPVDIVTSGVTTEVEERFRSWEEARILLELLGGQQEPVRLDDLPGYLRGLGLSDTPIPLHTLQAVPMRHRDNLVGSFFLADKENGPTFTNEDEEVLTLFAAQAAAAVANSRAHRAERSARANLEAVVETSPVGVVVFDAASGRSISFNREAQRIVKHLLTPGRPVESLTEEVVVRREDGRETALDRFPIAVALSAGETVRAEEIVLSVPDGRSVTTLVNVTPIRAEDGTVVSVVIAMQDLEPLQEMERQRADFLGLVSHELRAPLTAIKGSAATVLGAPTDLDPVETREFFRIIDEQADHMRVLIADLLDAGRIATGTLSVAPERTEVAALVEQARRVFLASGGDHPLHIDLPRDLPPVMADRQRIVQVLSNLFANAARHSPTASPIRIEVVSDGAFVAITVADRGVGVSPERLSRLFHKDADFPGGVGAGLGLAICKGLVEAHGGRIRAESAGAGQGTRVTFTIPAGGDVEELVRSRDDPNRSAKSRILVVDDDPRALRFARRALDRAGYVTDVTGDPGELGERIRRNRPDVVLLDLLFPDTDGIELLERVPELTDLPVVFISAYGRDETIARAFEAGAADYIVKPFSPTELVARIRAALRRSRAPETYRAGDLVIDYDQRLVTLAGRPVALTAKEYELLRILSVEAGRVATYEALKRRIWGDPENVKPELLRTFIKKLRRKLDDDAIKPAYIFTERGVGYRMRRPADARTALRGDDVDASPGVSAGA